MKHIFGLAVAFVGLVVCSSLFSVGFEMMNQASSVANVFGGVSILAGFVALGSAWRWVYNKFSKDVDSK